MGTEFERMWADLAPIGRTAEGGYRRFAWTDEDRLLREWFVAEAARRGLDVTTDRGGNLWAWWGDPDQSGPGVVTGSHLDSVPDGGAFDGPLGVVSALLAVDSLRGQGYRPSRPIGVAAFSDEEGARFGVACAGSRLITGSLAAADAMALTDDSGVTMGAAMSAFGHPVAEVRPDPETVRRIGAFVELHVEQGRGLVDLSWPVGVGDSIWPHGRWRVTLEGEANHAGTTLLVDRNDPMLPLADLIASARSSAELHGAVATVGKVKVIPNGVNAIPSHVTAWLDCRAAEESAVSAVLGDLSGRFDLARESWTPATDFDGELVERLARIVGGESDTDWRAPILGTGAGHDAGVLSKAGVPTAMLFVRNPTGASHTPSEFAGVDDCMAGVDALTRCLIELTAPG